MDNIIKNEELYFTDNNTPDKPILGVLEGPCADFMSATRNGRKYPESLWEKVFKDPIVSELIENGGIPGELDHPADREETDSSRIAIMMTEKPQKKNGKLWAKFSILNTPLGKIAYTLAKAGFKLGISSRGSGEVYEDATGSEVVDEDTYDFKAFDLVLVPAVKSARLNLVTEGLEKKFNYKQALKESLNEANDSDKQMMKDTLNNLNIHLNENYYKLVSYSAGDGETGISGDDFDIYEVIQANSQEEAESMLNPNHEEGTFVTDATEEEYQAYKDWVDSEEYQTYYANPEIDEQLSKATSDEQKAEIQSKIEKAAEEADIANDTNNESQAAAKAKEIEQLQENSENSSEKSLDIDGSADTDAVDNNEANVLNELKENLKLIQELQNKVINLNEKLSVCYTKEAEQNEMINNQSATIKKLSESSKQVEILNNRISKLTENTEKVNSKLKLESDKNKKLNETLKSTVEKYNSLVDEYNKSISEIEDLTSKNKSLQESLEGLKKDSELKTKKYSQAIEKSNSLVEKYRKVANNAADKYIKSQADKLGIKPQEIKNRLSEKYTFDDIDSICEDLQKYKLNVSKLPFQTNRALNEAVKKVDITPSKNDSITEGINTFDGDDVTDLLKMVQI